MTRHHYGISALGRQRKCRLFSQADVHHFQAIHGVYSLSPPWIFASEKKEWNLGQIERVLHQINLSVDASEIFWLLEKALRESRPFKLTIPTRAKVNTLKTVKSWLYCVTRHKLACVADIIRDLKIRRRRLQREHHKSNRFDNQNNNFARASRFFVHFFPSLHDYDVKMPNFTLYRGSTLATRKFPLSFWIWIRFLGIQLGSPTFDKVSDLE